MQRTSDNELRMPFVAPRQREDDLRQWLSGLGLLTLHVSFFLSGIVTLMLVNLATTPADRWAERVAWLWAVLLVIHALVVALLRLVALLRMDDTAVVAGREPHTNGEPAPAALAATAGTYSAASFADWPEPEPEPAPVSTLAPVPAADAAELPVAGSWSDWAPAGTEAAHETPPTRWVTTGSGMTSSDPLPTTDRASWEEAGIGAWLSRRGHDSELERPTEAPASPTGGTDDA
ncbi:MAG: hypothetical protein M3121_08655 [Chloroflexota bacterium]|nr:hypothetical protein [Chloroflexota bacterium]